MKRIYNNCKGYTLADCDCRYCLYYGGRRKGNETRHCLLVLGKNQEDGILIEAEGYGLSLQGREQIFEEALHGQEVSNEPQEESLDGMKL